MNAGWFSGIPAAAASVECGGATHTVQWRDGDFRIPAHGDPPDLEAERALAALAGKACHCVELLLAWERHAADPQVLLLGPRGHETLGTGRWAGYPGFQAHRRRLIQAGWVEEPTEDGLGALLSLEPPIPRRLVATVAMALLDRATEPEIADALYGALYGRLLAALRIWRASLPRLDLTIADAEPGLTQTADGAFLARLGLGWLTEVWGRDLDVVDDELTLSARPAPGGGFVLMTVDHALSVHTRTVLPA